MNIKNKQHNIFLDFKNSLMLKRLGYPQDNAAAYWSHNDRQLFPADKVAKFKGWEKLFTAAPADAELNLLLSASEGSHFSIMHKGRFYNASVPSGYGGVYQGIGTTEAEAKALLIKHLVKNKLLKFQ